MMFKRLKNLFRSDSMKKNLISMAVAASVAGVAAISAHANVEVNAEGTGQILLFPFYNADNGNATNMHIVNTTNEVKAVKLRFLEYKNSHEVLDFNLYLSPYDHFAFGVIKNPNGEGAAVITSDNSCTVPALGGPNGAFGGTKTENADGSITRIQPFVNYQYATEADYTIERTRTGHVEVIEMGVVSNVNTTTQAYAAWATHGATGVPAGCAKLGGAWAGGSWSSDASQGLAAPAGGLYGLAYHINVEEAAAWGFEPTALDNKFDSQQHSDPGALFPALSDGVNKNAVIKHGKGGDAHLVAGFANPISAVSGVLMTQALMNDVMLNPVVGGQTDWVITFPTKNPHVDPAAVAPFTDAWVGGVKGSSTSKENPACEKVKVGQWDREEAYTAQENGFSPSPGATYNYICNETAVIAMGAAGTESAMEVETGLSNLAFPYAEGWQRIGFEEAGHAMNFTTAVSTVSGTVKGLPAIGFAAYKVNNGAMSYGNAAEHKTDIVVSGVNGESQGLPN
jgi:hypothetical protein